MVFGDFDADGLTGLAILTLALRRVGVSVEPYVPSRLDEGHGLSLAAIDAAADRGVALIITVDCGTDQRCRDRRRQQARDRRHRHRPPPRAARPARRDRHRQPASAGRHATRTDAWPGAASRSRSRSCSSPTSRAARRPRSTWPTSRPSDPSPTSRRSWARTGPSRGSASSACAGAPRPGIAALLEQRPCRTRRRRPRDGRLRHRAAAQRSRPGWRGPRGREPPAGRRSGDRGASMPRRSKRRT